MARRRRRSRKLNPRRRRSAMPLLLAAPKRRRNRRRYRRNPAIAVYRRRRRTRRNPLLGGVGAQQIVGGLTGVAATRFISKLIPPALLGFAGQFGPLLGDLVSAVFVSWVTDKMGGERLSGFRQGIPFGAAMQVGSTAIATFVPGLRQYGFGIGALVPGQFPIPQNPIRPLALPAADNGKTRVTTSGLRRAFGTAL